MILNALKFTAQTLIKKYGAETAFVGKIAISAFLPGGGELVEKGFEALFDYVSDHADRHANQSSPQDLKLVEGIDQQGFAQLLGKLDESQVFDQINHLQKQGLNAQQIQVHILAQINLNVHFKELKTDFERINQGFQAVHKKLDQLQHGVQVMIQGQAMQEESIQQMIALLRQISGQIGIQVPTIQVPTIQDDQVYQAQSQDVQSFDLKEKFQSKVKVYEVILDRFEGNQIKMIQYLCNELQYDLSDAILTLNQLPKVIYTTPLQVKVLKLMSDLSDLGGIARQRKLKD